MKIVLFSVAVLFAFNNSFAQSTSDTTDTHCDESITIRRGREVYYYIDGIKVEGPLPDSTQQIEEIYIITGGIPFSSGDLTNEIIPKTVVPNPVIAPSIRDKKENQKTE